VDVTGVLLLGLFLAWGAFHGALRQLLGFAVLVPRSAAASPPPRADRGKV
jgi:hypothetical protein